MEKVVGILSDVCVSFVKDGGNLLEIGSITLYSADIQQVCSFVLLCTFTPVVLNANFKYSY